MTPGDVGGHKIPGGAAQKRTRHSEVQGTTWAWNTKATFMNGMKVIAPASGVLSRSSSTLAQDKPAATTPSDRKWGANRSNDPARLPKIGKRSSAMTKIPNIFWDQEHPLSLETVLPGRVLNLCALAADEDLMNVAYEVDPQLDPPRVWDKGLDDWRPAGWSLTARDDLGTRCRIAFDTLEISDRQTTRGELVLEPGPHPEATALTLRLYGPSPTGSGKRLSALVRVDLPLPRSSTHVSAEYAEKSMHVFNSDLPAGCRLTWRQDGETEMVVKLLGPGTETLRSWRLWTGGSEAGWAREDELEQMGERLHLDISTLLSEAQGAVIRQVLGRAWPRCPVHGSHLLEPTSNIGAIPFEGWECQLCKGPGFRWPYGTLASTNPPAEPKYSDGQFLWWGAGGSWGVIAHHDGDIYIDTCHMFTDSFPADILDLQEGQPLGFSLDIRDGQVVMEGLFRRARTIWPLTRMTVHDMDGRPFETVDPPSWADHTPEPPDATAPARHKLVSSPQ